MTHTFRISSRARVSAAVIVSLLLVSAAHASFVARAESVSARGEALAPSRTEAAALEQTANTDTSAEAASKPVSQGGTTAGSEIDQESGTGPGPDTAPNPAPATAPPAPVFDQPKPGAPVVALTFDDGPWPGQTEQVLGLLAERRCPATFFMIGQQVERWPSVAQAVARAGQPIGNHTYSHRRLDVAPPDVVEWEIVHTTHIIQDVTATHPYWFRAPGGNFSEQVYVSSGNAIAQPVLWTVDPQDWDSEVTTDQIIGNVLGSARPNAIICLHDGGGDQSKTIAALPAIIDGLRAQGYEFVTLDRLPEVRSRW